MSGSGISWAVCKSAPRSRQITTPAPHHSVFTGWMPFLPPNQQRQSTDNHNNNNRDNVYGDIITTKVIARVHPVHLMNVDWAPGGRQPSDRASRLGLWVHRVDSTPPCSISPLSVHHVTQVGMVWSKVLRPTHTHNCLTALFPVLPGWASTRKVKPIWILLKQETVSGSGISWTICKSAPRCRQITTPAPHHSVFYRLSCRPTNSIKALKAKWHVICK